MKCFSTTTSKFLSAALALFILSLGSLNALAQETGEPSPSGPTGPAQPAPVVKKAYLGIQVQPVTVLKADYLKKLQLPKGAGLVVVFVQPGSPADQAGIKSNQVIAAFDQQTLFGLEHFKGLMGTKKPGQTIRLSVFNNKAVVRTVSVRLGSSADKPTIHVQKGDPDPTNQNPGPNALRDTKVEIKDAYHYIVITIKPSKAQHLLVKDNKNKTLFNGPITTSAEQTKVPKNISNKITTYASRLPIKWYMKKVKFAPTPGPTKN